MSKVIRDEENALVPRLRFPEFRDAGAWEAVYLGDLGAFTGGGTPSKTESEYWQGDIPWISSSDVSDESIRDVSITRFITKKALTESATKLIPGGSILLISRVGVGKLAIIESPVCTSQDFTNFTPSKDSPIFLGYYLKANGQALENLCQGMAIRGFTKEDISKLILCLPKLNEQQKIADCLSSLDTLIAAQAEKIDALKTHKKGLMQQLFPREGETVPRLRFPEFRGAGGWVNRKLIKLLRKISDPVKVEENEIYREIGIRSHGKGIFHKEPVSGKGIGNKRVFWIEENVFIVNIVFAWELAVANTTKAESGMIASHRFPMYRPIEGKADVRYMKYFFLTHKGKELLWIASPGGAGRNKTLGQKDFENLEFLVPGCLEEQQKIADCLSSLDALIAAQAEKLDALKTHKSGLMQQLFPSSKEIEG